MNKEELRKIEEEEKIKEIVREIMERLNRKETEERRKKIEESKYNNIYKEIMLEDVPGYPQGKEKIRIAKYIY